MVITEALPDHLAIIPDGNRRWAVQNKKRLSGGYLAGLKKCWETALLAKDLGISFLSFFAFSADNWQRPSWEVQSILNLLFRYLDRSVSDISDHKIKFRVFGDLSVLSKKHRVILDKFTQNQPKDPKLVLNLLFNYTGRWDIISACQQLVDLSGTEGKFQINAEMLSSRMMLGDCPFPDLLIRTSGEQRLSNFLLWDLAYTEFYFTSVFWPDFSADEFKIALKDYGSRKRRYGAGSSQNYIRTVELKKEKC